MLELPEMKSASTSFINRDHVVMIIVMPDEVILRTSLGLQIKVQAMRNELKRFVDDLANHVESNYVVVNSADVSFS